MFSPIEEMGSRATERLRWKRSSDVGADDVELHAMYMELAGQRLSGFGTIIDVMWLLTLYGEKAGLEKRTKRRRGNMDACTHSMEAF